MLGGSGMKVKKSWVKGTEIVLYAITSPNPGPKVVVTANLHGDECTGFAVVLELLEKLPKMLRCGHVALYPSLNPSGLSEKKRFFPPTGTDLNRDFPGSEFGGRSQQYNARIWKSIQSQQPDVLIDLHADSFSAMPYILVDRVLEPSQKKLEEHSWRIAKASTLFVLGEYPIEQYKKYSLDRSLAGCAVNRLLIPAVTIEAGPRRCIDGSSVRLAHEATLRILDQLGLIRNPAPSPLQSFPAGKWYRMLGPCVNHDGVFVPLARVGTPLKKGMVLGKHYTLEGQLQQAMLMSRDGMVISFPDIAFLKAGQSCVTLAAREV